MMRRTETRRALAAMVDAAREAGALLRRHQHGVKRVNASTQHDIKLELDVRCQRLIERRLRHAGPDTAVLGEEGVVGDPEADRRWVVDPIDGTVNFTYGIPHAAVSIALQQREPAGAPVNPPATRGEPVTVAGVVYDPFSDELWTATRGGPARLNGRITRVSPRGRLAEAIVSIGFAKDRQSLRRMLPVFGGLIHRVRKIRMMGSAALALTYVASGRMDGYIESGISLWDIAAGGLILECAGGRFSPQPLRRPYRYRLLASNRRLADGLERLLAWGRATR